MSVHLEKAKQILKDAKNAPPPMAGHFDRDADLLKRIETALTDQEIEVQRRTLTEERDRLKLLVAMRKRTVLRDTINAPKAHDLLDEMSNDWLAG